MAADPSPAPASNAQKAVLVSSASTGIGRKFAERLAKEGTLSTPARARNRT